MTTWRALLSPALVAALVLVSANARAEEEDSADDYAATALAAAESMYLETDFDGADELLQAAIQRCEKETCKLALHARLHVMRAEVLVSGLQQKDAAKDAMIAALEVSPGLKLDQNLDSQALFALYDEAKKELVTRKNRPKPRPKKGVEPSGAGEPAPEPEEEIRRNWIRVPFMVDLSLLIAEQDICSPSVQDESGWFCTRTDESRYRGVPTKGQQNAVDTTLQLSTMRALVGYERVLGDNFTLGLRLGYVFRPVPIGSDEGFIPFHGEGRAAYWFGDNPFADVVRPNLFIAAGFGPVITNAELTVVEDGTVCGAVDPISGDCAVATDPARNGPEPRVQRLQANKTAGQGFGSLGFGLSFSPTPVLMIDFGVRVSATFPVFTPVLSPEAGLSFGF